MAIETAVGRWCLRCMLVLCALILCGSLEQVQANETGADIGIVPPTTEPGQSSDAGGGGDVKGPPDQELPDGPKPEDDPAPPPPTEEPGTGGGGRDNEAVAPGMVTVVLYTSDGGTTADRTMVCVGDTCQPAGTQASGYKVVFDRITTGWHEVSVRSGAPYGGTSSSVAVQSGQHSLLELTLVRAESLAGSKDEVTPVPVSATGPLRVAPQLQQATTAPGWNGQVTALPETGTGPLPSAWTSLPGVLVAIGTASLLGAMRLRVGFRTRQPWIAR